MTYWWENNSNERYWAEITDRDDMGANLKCPVSNESGGTFWSYNLIKSVRPGDVVFHYSTPMRAFVGASVVGYPLRRFRIIWAPHGTVGRARGNHEERDGWMLPINRFVESDPPLTLEYLSSFDEREWIYAWIERKEQEIELRHAAGEKALSRNPYAPLQRYGRFSDTPSLRATQGYLTKMPLDFVDRWRSLTDLVDRLAADQAYIDSAQESLPAGDQSVNEPFSAKSAEEYVAYIKSARQVRGRFHEALINTSANLFKSEGFETSNPFPIDLLLSGPVEVIVEGKIVSNEKPIYAVRHAIGQLLEYRYFLRRPDAKLCVLLDKNPGWELIEYVEIELGAFIVWNESDYLQFGPVSARYLTKSEKQ